MKKIIEKQSKKSMDVFLKDEIYSKIYSLSSIVINDIVDPTSDIDIKIFSPVFTIKNEEEIIILNCKKSILNNRIIC